eukprot:1847662-Pleurochrysis_carterae.AAC.1
MQAADLDNIQRQSHSKDSAVFLLHHLLPETNAQPCLPSPIRVSSHSSILCARSASVIAAGAWLQTNEEKCSSYQLP